MPIPSRIIATCFALSVFAATVVVGAVAANTVETILWRAIQAAAVAWIIGRVMGGIAEGVVSRAIEQKKAANPIPTDADALEEATRTLLDQQIREHGEAIEEVAGQIATESTESREAAA